MFKVGDRVKQRYISDNNIHNNMTAEITWINTFKYYPNGDYSVVKERIQAHIKYVNGDTEYVVLDTDGFGILSPFELVK